MIKALLLLIRPVPAWERVVRAQRSLVFVWFLYLTPMVVITAAVEGWGLTNKGCWQMGGRYLKKFPVGNTVVYEVASVLLSFGIVFLSARIIKSLGETFHGRNTYTQAFTLVAYGLSPLFLLRLLDAFPAFSPWLTWGIGITLSASVLYQGVPRVMMPDPPHAFGLYFMSVVLLTMITGLTRFVTAWYLQGHFKPVEDVIGKIAARLPF
jgi:Yip1 domain